MPERANRVSAGPSTATAKKQVGTGKSNVPTLDVISPIARTMAIAGMPRQHPIVDAEAAQQQAIAPDRARQRSPLIDADARQQQQQRAVVASGRQCAPMMIAEDLEIWLDGQRSNRACGLYVWGRV